MDRTLDLAALKAAAPVCSSRAITPFARTLAERGIALARLPLEILQVNVGKLCNQACHHCHVDAGPRRTELMSERTAERVLCLLAGSPSIHTVDLTGGAPELNPLFRRLVVESRRLGKEVIDRCNLTVLFEGGQEDTAAFLREHRVQVVASLPCYSNENVDLQRGHGVFERSIRALLLLNELGYGRPGTGLTLHLVYNPLGAFLPPPQEALERDYREELKARFGIEFNLLFTLANMPIKRFLRELARTGKVQEYMDLLLASFNPQAARAVMCRSLLSVGWDGRLHDCDFNQMLEIGLAGRATTLWDVASFDEIRSLPIAVADHCYGCTAGAGSSCGGALA